LFEEKGQVSIEIVVIGTVLLALLLVTAIFMTQKNLETSRMLAIKRDNQTCQKISQTITNFNLGKDYSQTKMQALEKNIRIEKRSIIIEQSGGGSISCRYSGQARLEYGTTGQLYANDSDGFNLKKEIAGNSIIYKVKKIGFGVVFCNYAKDWC